MKLERTITSIFMMPTLKIDADVVKAMRFDKAINFINAYSYDKLRTNYPDNAVFLLFKPSNLFRFKELLEIEYKRKGSTIADHYDYNGGYVVVVYLLNKKLNDDFEQIKKGKYSKTSPEYQNIIPKTVKVGIFEKEEISLQYRIFNKTKDLVKFWEDQFDMVFDAQQEIWHGFFDEKETLNFAKIQVYA